MDTGLKRQIMEKCAGLDIPVVGFTSADAWDTPLFEPWVPEEFRPRAIYPETQSVIVIGLPVSLPVLETAPSIWYHELYKTVNNLLDENAYRIALSLTRSGFPSVAVPRDGYGSITVLKERPVAFFSHRHAAYLAGLGSFGTNNMLLTREFGPRIRFTSIFTTAEIPPDPVMEENLCTKCQRCSTSCPVKALGGGGYPSDITDKSACSIRSEALSRRFVSPCGICIKVCPVGEDRKSFSREKMAGYDEKNPELDAYHRAWSHVRKYGGL
jgi:epoxyqueuosine reductase